MSKFCFPPIKHLLALFYIFTLSACVNNGFPLLTYAANGPAYEENTEVISGKAILYIYRPFRFVGGGVGTQIYVNRHRIVLLKNKGYTKLVLDPSEYTVESVWPHSDLTKSVVILKPNTVNFVRLTFSDAIDLVDYNLGSTEIKSCNYQKPEISVF